MTYVVEAVCVLAALVFGASAAAKLGSPGAYRRFRAAMAGTGLLPPRLRALGIASLAGAELIAALSLGAAAVVKVTGPRSLGAVVPLALGLAALLAGVLVAGVAVLVRRGVPARCACFGASDSGPIGVPHLVRNLTLLGIVLLGLAARLADLGLAGPGPTGPGPAGAVAMAAAAGGCGALLIIRWEDLAVLFTPVPAVRRSRAAGRGVS
jgi:hypothetical protein